jgi:hypothetical protein
MYSIFFKIMRYFGLSNWVPVRQGWTARLTPTTCSFPPVHAPTKTLQSLLQSLLRVRSSVCFSTSRESSNIKISADKVYHSSRPYLLYASSVRFELLKRRSLRNLRIHHGSVVVGLGRNEVRKFSSSAVPRTRGHFLPCRTGCRTSGASARLSAPQGARRSPRQCARSTSQHGQSTSLFRCHSSRGSIRSVLQNYKSQ